MVPTLLHREADRDEGTSLQERLPVHCFGCGQLNAKGLRIRSRWRERAGRRRACRGNAMKAVICRAFDGPDALVIGELPDPTPGPGEVLVDVHAAAVTFMDVLMVSGKYQMKPALPFAPGNDAA